MKTGLLLILLLLCGAMSGFSQTLTFEGLQSGEEVLNYYNGGAAQNTPGPGPNYGITFGSSAVALTEAMSNVANTPSPVTFVYFTSGPGVVMNVSGGFSTGFSFYYAAASQPGSVTVWDGLNGSGNLLATLTLPVTGSNCNGSAKSYSCWQSKGVSFAGTARSVSFGGVANYIAFDNITINSATPGGATQVPALSWWAMAGTAAMLCGFGWWMSRRRAIRSA